MSTITMKAKRMQVVGDGDDDNDAAGGSSSSSVCGCDHDGKEGRSKLLCYRTK